MMGQLLKLDNYKANLQIIEYCIDFNNISINCQEHDSYYLILLTKEKPVSL